MIDKALAVVSTAIFKAAKSFFELRGDYLQANIALDEAIREADFKHDDRLGDLALEALDGLSQLAKPLDQDWVNAEIRRVRRAYDPLEVEGEQLAEDDGYHFVTIPVDKVIDAVGGEEKFMDLFRVMVDAARFSLDPDVKVRLVGFDVGGDNEVSDELLRAVRAVVTREDYDGRRYDDIPEPAL